MNINKYLPQHVAFIVDGNRRWAKRQGLPAIAGHKFVVEKVLDPLITHAIKRGISYLTFWVFSTENWKRGKAFATFLFGLLKKGIRQRAEEYHKQGIRFKVIGDPTGLPKDLMALLLSWQEKSKNNKKITVTLAINYGGREEIVRACQRVLKLKIKNEKLKITKEEFGKYLDTAGMPDPDLIIRTGGESRLSGFLPWQSQYSELYFTKTLMPDFNPKEFDKALEWYRKRERRFGR